MNGELNMVIKAKKEGNVYWFTFLPVISLSALILLL